MPSAAYQRLWRRSNPAACRRYRVKRRAYHRAYLIQWKYGLNQEQFKALLSAQDNRCAICENEFSNFVKGRKLHVDHGHTTGHIRGLLCRNCNQGLGLFSDSVNILRHASQYLNGSRASLLSSQNGDRTQKTKSTN